jgi:putative DNA primase/helicase
MPDLGEENGRAELDRIIAQCQPNVVILDSISTLVRSGVENEAESWGPIQDWLLKHRWQGRTMITVHHTGRSGDPRGTSKREDTLDTIIKLRKLEDDSTATESAFELTFSKYRDFFGDDAAPLNIYLSIPDDRVTWRYERKRNAQQDKVRELLDAGMKNKEIAKELGITPGRVSQLIREMKRADNVLDFAAKREREREV